MSESQWVIGECFTRATVQPRLTTAARLRERLRAERPSVDEPLRLRPGLGVDPGEWSDLCDDLAKRYGDAVLPQGEPASAVPRDRVLKHARDNVVVGDAWAEGECFSGWLAVANDTEMIRDHTAEQQHIPGMLLIEAAIQLVTWAVSELYPVDADRPPYYAVMHGCSFEFHRFAFPLPTRLHGRIFPSGEVEEGKIPLRAEAEIEQAGQVCGAARFELHAFDPELVFAIEDGQAASALDRLSAQDDLSAPDLPAQDGGAR
ncbi:A-factor biosynthesis hotdog domain-containing protein [Nonomuraea solani]|uniref:A-factor biosynthesis hotdog domain-containing protein n=1 Tax=Nonomuraea solani TaxID=1144553 RepID=A0A1H6ECA3_9ACTN|nr:AfsA-related hotdog domain-containing protein [Nonomuraea solani]SEG95440.1 A-factor biosynthesis hotdog domain-containing protein [Nonomuraea solani]